MAVSHWSASHALRAGAICGLVVGAFNALDARGWVFGPLSSFIIQTLATGLGGSLLFWLAAIIWNWFGRSS